MPEFFSDMNFVQAVNPLYALPVVAVMLCIFLVYAFGFKSVAQPPSFDEIENDKKSIKRRKMKENSKEKNKHQNGKVSSLGKASEITMNEKRKKSEKVVIEKGTTKAESKDVKKPAAINEKKKVSNLQPSFPVEDESDDGWVHHVSKKGRKNRKKDDNVANMDIIQPSLIQAEIVDDIFNKMPKNALSDGNTAEQKGLTIDSNLMNGDSSNILMQEKVLKTNAIKKSKKKKDKENIDIVADIPEAIISEDTKSKVAESPIDVTPQLVLEDFKASNEKKPSKKKKKKIETEAVVPPETSLLNLSCLNENTNKDKFSDANPQIVDDGKDAKIDEIYSKSFTTNDLQNGNKTNDSKEEPIVAKGLNVAFDELADLCPDSKPQKKKKKVRRD